MRWSPYPTCRLPLRRFIAILLTVSLTVPSLAVAEDGGANEGRESDNDYLCSYVTDADGNTNPNADKIKRIPTDLENATPVHRDGSLDPVRAMIERHNNPPPSPAAPTRPATPAAPAAPAPAAPAAPTAPARTSGASQAPGQSDEAPAAPAAPARSAAPAASEKVPTIEQSVVYQDQFAKDFISNNIEICKHLSSAGRDFKTLSDTIGKTKFEGCDFSKPESLMQQAGAKREEFKSKYETFETSLKDEFREWATYNYKAVAMYNGNVGQVPAEQQNALRLKGRALVSEFKKVWGSNASEAELKKSDYKFDKNSVFGALIHRVQNQAKVIDQSSSYFNHAKAKLMEAERKCGVSPGGGSPLPGGRGQGSDITGKAAPDANLPAGSTSVPDCSGRFSAECLSQGMKANGTWGQADPDNRPGASGVGRSTTPGSGDGNGGGNNNGGGNGGGGNNNGGGNTTPAPGASGPAASTHSVPNTETSVFDDAGKWASDNKGLLIVGGVGAAAAAGVLYYMKTEEDKNHRAGRLAELEANMTVAGQQQQATATATATATTTDTTTSTSTDTTTTTTSGGSSSTTTVDSTVGSVPITGQAAPGSTLLVQGTPTGALTNQTVDSFVVKVLSPNGVMSADSFTQVTVSCRTPVPCDLSGTLTVTTDAGKASFTNLHFSNTHTGVQLKFSAPGFADSYSGTFDVNKL